MISIGNDIVSLESARSKRFVRKEYYSKIISSTEKNYFDQQLQGKLLFVNYVWLLWSIKEAAYKYFKRLNQDLLFNPLKFFVENIKLENNFYHRESNEYLIEEEGFDNYNCINSTINILTNTIAAKSIISEEYIFSVVSEVGHFDKIYWGIKQISQTNHIAQSDEVRNFVIEKLKNCYTQSLIQIQKSASNIPSVLIDKKQQNIVLSFTHHEKYVAYSYFDNESVESRIL